MSFNISPVSILTSIAQSKPIQRCSTYLSKPQVVKTVDNWFPLLDSGYVTALYMLDITRSKTIPEPRKNPLVIQSGLCFVGGALGGMALNKAIKPFQAKVIEIIEKSTITNKKVVISGIKTIIPLVIVSFMLRYFIPVISTPISVWLDRLKARPKSATMDSFIKSIKKDS